MLIVQQSALFSKTDLHILNYKNREKHLAYYKNIKNIFQLRWIILGTKKQPKKIIKILLFSKDSTEQYFCLFLDFGQKTCDSNIKVKGYAMSDFSNLLIELSSPEDRAAYDNYRADLDSVNDYIEKKIAQSKEAFETASHPSFSKRIAFFFSSTRRKHHRKDIENLRYEYAGWKFLKGSPEALIHRDKRPEKTFVELSTGAKQYAVLKQIVDMAQQAGETDQQKVINVYKTFREQIEEYPLIDISPNDCLKRCGSKQTCNTINWDQVVSQYQTIKAQKEETQQFSDIKHVSLTKFFKGHFCDKYSEVIDIIKRCDVSRDAGCLPPEWIAILPKEQIAEKTKKISKIFQNFSKQIYSSKKIRPKALAPALKHLEEKLSEALGVPITASYLGNGEIGKAIKIVTNNDKALVLKTNHSDPKFTPSSGHGTQIEGIRGLYVSNNHDKKQYTTTYFTRVGDSNAIDSFVLSRFIDKSTVLKENSSQKKDNNIEGERRILAQVINADEHDENSCNNKYIEFGGCYIPEILRDPKNYKLFKTLYKSLKRKDGPQLINKIVKSCSKSANMQHKFRKIKELLQYSLTTHTPDIDIYGNVYNYGFRPECMEALGVTNQIDLFSAIDRANDNETMAYIIASRGGKEKVSDTIRIEAQKVNDGTINHINPRKTEYLMANGIQASTIKHAIFESYLPEFTYHVDRYNKEAGLTSKNGMQGFIKTARAKILS